MQLYNKNNYAFEVKLKSALLLLAVALNALEFFFPRIPLFPWLKPGIANIVTIAVIIKFGFRDALLFAFLRIWIVSFYFGFSFLNVALALSGSVLAISIMSSAYNLTKKSGFLGLVGISVLGAVCHNIGQLIAVYFILLKNQFIFYQIPFMIIIASMTGSLNGLLASFLIKSLSDDNMKQLQVEKPNVFKNNNLEGAGNLWVSIFLFLFCSGLIFVNNIKILSVLMVLTIFIVQIILKFDLKPLILPIKRFWLIFIAIAVMNLMYSYGRIIPYLKFITYEGVEITLSQWIRIFTWLQATYLFLHFKTHLIVFSLLKKRFPNNTTMLAAGLESVEYFPLVLDAIRKNASETIVSMFKSPQKAMSDLISTIIKIQDENL